MRIIDRDCDFYDSMIDKHVSDLRACAPSDEDRHRALRDAARDARNALVAYRRLIDGAA